jgi:uncharacterized membrane protein YkvA (DUF1232 family)
MRRALKLPILIERRKVMSELTKSVLIVIATVLYVICPLDGDFIPVLGWLDDIVVIWLCIDYFRGKERSRKEAVEHYRAGKQTRLVKSVPARRHGSTPGAVSDVIDVEFEARNRLV